MAYYSIALDGPSGVGKSTIAKSIAAKLGYVYIDTGAMYRALGVYFYDCGIAAEDEQRVNDSLDGVSVRIAYMDGTQHVFVNDRDVTDRLRTEEISRMASVTSQYKAVRAKLLSLQRELAETASVIMDGRDIGTVVLPNATLKVFLTASSAVRAERRYKQLIEQGLLGGATKEEIQKDIEERDYRDSHREQAPLKQAEDAVLVDNSELTLKETEDAIINALQNRINI